MRGSFTDQAGLFSYIAPDSPALFGCMTFALIGKDAHPR